MAERKQGVHKTEAEKAQELLDKQKVLVERLEKQGREYRDKLTEIDHQLGQEYDLLDYYERHPLLKQTPAQKGEPLKLDEPELPLDYMSEPEPMGKVKVGGKMAWKGYEGKHASE